MMHESSENLKNDRKQLAQTRSTQHFSTDHNSLPVSVPHRLGVDGDAGRECSASHSMNVRI